MAKIPFRGAHVPLKEPEIGTRRQANIGASGQKPHRQMEDSSSATAGRRRKRRRGPEEQHRQVSSFQFDEIVLPKLITNW